MEVQVKLVGSPSEIVAALQNLNKTEVVSSKEIDDSFGDKLLRLNEALTTPSAFLSPKIHCIKTIREFTGWGLVQSKEFMEKSVLCDYLH